MEFLITQSVQAALLIGVILLRERLLRKQMRDLENRLLDRINDVKGEK